MAMVMMRMVMQNAPDVCMPFVVVGWPAGHVGGGYLGYLGSSPDPTILPYPTILNLGAPIPTLLCEDALRCLLMLLPCSGCCRRQVSEEEAVRLQELVATVAPPEVRARPVLGRRLPCDWEA